MVSVISTSVACLGCSLRWADLLPGSAGTEGQNNGDLATDRPRALARDAATREQLWRRVHDDVYAVEALELLAELGSLATPDSCEAQIRRELLQGELYNDPERTLVAVQKFISAFDVGTASESSDGSNENCVASAERVLRVLGAYRPGAEPSLAAAAAQGASPVVGSDGAKPLAAGSSGARLKGLDRPVVVERLEQYASRDTARLTVHLNRPTAFHMGELIAAGPHGWRLALDVTGAILEADSAYTVGGIVERVQLSEQPSGVRVVFEVNARVASRVFYLPEPFRLVIDLFGEERRRTPIEPGRLTRVVLDPGHGGTDTGAKGSHGLLEKDVALDIAHRAAPLIARELGASTLLTRDTDTFVALDERVARANAFGADLFVSIHCNASEDAGQTGVMTFVLDASKDEVAARIAARENFASSQAGTELTAALGQMLDRETLRLSGHFAGLLQRSVMSSLVAYPGVRDGGVRRAGFYVLAGAEMPAVLFETSFISNWGEEERLAKREYRQQLADALVNAIRAYREGY